MKWECSQEGEQGTKTYMESDTGKDQTWTLGKAIKYNH